MIKKSAKIVATIGPASRESETIEALFNAGVDVFRLNFSHGEHKDHKSSAMIVFGPLRQTAVGLRAFWRISRAPNYGWELSSRAPSILRPATLSVLCLTKLKVTRPKYLCHILRFSRLLSRMLYCCWMTGKCDCGFPSVRKPKRPVLLRQARSCQIEKVSMFPI